MPIKVQRDLPAIKVLESENIFVMPDDRADTQDIRPLRIVIVNLMPNKVETETQLLRMLGNSPLQIDVELLQMATHTSKNVSQHHLTKFYKTFDDIKDQRFDGMIITGAPVEQLEFEQVDYWEELQMIMDWSKHNVYSTFQISWGAQAGLYHHYGVEKLSLNEKLSGIYNHKILDPLHPLLRGFDDYFYLPHSRFTEVSRESIEQHDDLQILGISELAGVAIVANKNGRQFFVLGHAEYDRNTLAKEYYRDKYKGLNPNIPYNYFRHDDPASNPPMVWRSNATQLYTNWLNYFVYQQTPYDLQDLKEYIIYK